MKLGSVSFIRAAGTGYLIGLSDDGHRIEAIGDWRMLAPFQDELEGAEPTYVDVESWQVIAVDGEIKLDLGCEAMTERAAFVRAAMGHTDGTHAS